MEAFLGQLQIVLPVLSVNVIRTRTTRTQPAPASDSPTFHLVNAKIGVDAQAQVNGDEFTLLAGSTVVGAWTTVGRAESTRRSYAAYRAQHDKLVADGSIVSSREDAVDSPATSRSAPPRPQPPCHSAAPATAASNGPGTAAPTQPGRTAASPDFVQFI